MHTTRPFADPGALHRALELGGDISVTKTRAGRRFIDLSANTFDLVKHYANNHAHGSTYDLIFPTQICGFWQ